MVFCKWRARITYVIFRDKTIRFLSLNVGGIAGYAKRQKLFDHFLYPVNNDLKPQIICFQETRLDSSIEKLVLNHAQYDMCFAHKSADQTAGGLITGFERSLNYCLIEYEHFTLSNSQSLMIKCEIHNVPYVIINNYYHPHDYQTDIIFDILSANAKFIDKSDTSRVVLCGDFNTILSDIACLLNATDRSYMHKNRSKILFDFMDSLELSDIFRTFNPDLRRYSFFRANYAARLDFFLASSDVLNQTIDSSYGIAYATDHAPNYLLLSADRNLPGRNYWKFSSYLLNCNQYKDGLRNLIPILINRHKHECSPALLWDFLKSKIRAFTISFVRNKNILKKQRIEEMEARIAKLHNESLQLHIDGVEYKALKSQIAQCIDQFNSVHKADWKDYCIG